MEKLYSKYKKDFPIFSSESLYSDIIYLDNAATTHKPKCVIDCISNFTSYNYATVRRGIYESSYKATEIYENIRVKVSNFISSDNKNQIIFTSGTTQSINLVASSFCESFLNKGDEIIISEMEHHANILPWQEMSKKMGLVLKYIPVNKRGELDLDIYTSLLNERTKFVSVVHVSNILGTVNDVKKITKMAHSYGAKVLIDGAQAVGHFKVDVQDINCDFYVFSGHKMYGPDGVGVLYGKYNILKLMKPYVFGGEMIKKVGKLNTTYTLPPARFEAGTPPISQVIGLGAALDYINSIGIDNIYSFEAKLSRIFISKFSKLDYVNFLGDLSIKTGIFSFNILDIHSHDVSSILDSHKVCIRSGHHCAQILADAFKVISSNRVSFGIYNSEYDIDILIQSINHLLKVFKKI